jgi:HEAT repeat protein
MNHLAAMLIVVGIFGRLVAAGELEEDVVWQALPRYQYGDDLSFLLVIERCTMESMASPETRAACATRLASLLDDDGTTLAAKQHICLQLQRVGTSEQVPTLAKMLANEETAEMARVALEQIPGKASVAALRNALNIARGNFRIALVHSLGVRQDVNAVSELIELAQGTDQALAAAALAALGEIASDPAYDYLYRRAQQLGSPTPVELATPLLRCAELVEDDVHGRDLRSMYELLAEPAQPKGVRRAALNRLLEMLQVDHHNTIVEWLAGSDAERRAVALSQIDSLSDEALGSAIASVNQLTESTHLALIEVLARRNPQSARDLAIKAIDDPRHELKLVGIRIAENIADPAFVPPIIGMLHENEPVSQSAVRALVSFPRDQVGPLLLQSLNQAPERLVPVLQVLKAMRYYEAINPLVELAAKTDSTTYILALDALRTIADPDDADLSQLVQLVPKTTGKHREEVERTIVIVANKLPAESPRAEPVLAALAKYNLNATPDFLSLLGRLGGPRVLELINRAIDSDDLQTKNAAIRALCNWPNADQAERLWQIATQTDDLGHRRAALRAYVRVVTLPNERPDDRTLGMLQQAMAAATEADDRRWIVQRAATVRSMDCVNWLAQYLHDSQLNQVACASIVELAHHRFLRHPNMDRFGPLLDEVGQISRDPAIVERAKKYRLGL